MKKSFYTGILAGAAVTYCVMSFVGALSSIKTGLFKDISVGDKITAISSLLEQYYVEDFDESLLEEGIYGGLVSSLGDPYTAYLSAENMQEFMQDTDGEFYGIGVEVYMAEDGKITVISPIAGTPAAEAGILPGDKILKADDVDLSGMSTNEAINYIKGKEGTTVKLTILRENSGSILDIEVKRGKISMISVNSEILDENIGYIHIKQFRKNTAKEFEEQYNELREAGIKGLVIDLRYNPGGLVDVTTKIADTLVPEGVIVSTIDKEGHKESTTSDAECIDIPLCILVNDYSASASEILSGAVQDLGVGKLVGTTTFGKGLVQGLFSLNDGSGVKITIQKYYTPNGVCIQGTGIEPDYVVELPEEYQNILNVPREFDTQLEKAIEVINSESAAD